MLMMETSLSILFYLLFLPLLSPPLSSSLSLSAFDQTGRIINITVAPINNYDPPRLLNYLTAPHVCVWSAACASCAVPGLFDSITLIVKGTYVHKIRTHNKSYMRSLMRAIQQHLHSRTSGRIFFIISYIIFCLVLPSDYYKNNAGYYYPSLHLT